MIDLHTVKDSYQKMEIEDVEYIKSEFNLADPLNKIKLKQILMDVLQNSKLDHPVGR